MLEASEIELGVALRLLPPSSVFIVAGPVCDIIMRGSKGTFESSTFNSTFVSLKISSASFILTSWVSFCGCVGLLSVLATNLMFSDSFASVSLIIVTATVVAEFCNSNDLLLFLLVSRISSRFGQ